MKKIHIITIVLIACTIGVILATVSDSSTYANFAEAKKNQDEVFHVVGKLNKEKAIEFNPQENANLFSFYLIDNAGLETKVIYNGSKPQDFERSEQIVITGKYHGEQFYADKILMKCPSKYNNGQTEIEVASNSK
jgi:cytochrome c-type biogenesis protein CcmE